MPDFLRILLPSTIVASLLLHAAPVRGQDAPDEPRLACDRAAARAESAWSLPTGLLAAIGTVESGRPDPTGSHRRAWPWSINAEGWSHIASSRTEAVSTVAALQARGFRYIDVGCFQVDLAFHPRAFGSLEQAFDPDANAQAAARILSQARFRATSWERAIAAYHSASVLRGAWYLQRVLAVWPSARARLALLDTAPRPLPVYAVLLSPQASLVRIVTPADPAAALAPGLPRVIAPMDVPGLTRLLGAPADLPRVLAPPDTRAPRPARRL
ncbi:MAG: hypothetical protein WDN25_11105 [Acetobacteraceae bacterium]